MLSNLLYEASITLIPKPDKDISKKKTTEKKKKITKNLKKTKNNKKENYRPVSFLDTDVEILNNILANQIYQCIKRIMYHK